MSQIIYCYQVAPILKYPHNQIIDNSQIKDPTCIEVISNQDQKAVLSDQYIMNNQYNQTYDQKNINYHINSYHNFIQNPTQLKEMNQYNSRIMYCMPQYMQFYTNQNSNYPQQYFQITQAQSQQYQMGLSSYNNQQINYQNSLTKEICIQPTQCTEQQRSPQQQQFNDKQNLASIFGHQEDSQIMQKQKIQIDKNCDKSNYFTNKKIIAYDKNVSSEQGEVQNSERINDYHDIEQENQKESTQDRSIIRKNVTQLCKIEEQASLNKLQPKNRRLFSFAEQPQIYSQNNSQNSLSSFDKINILKGQSEKDLNSVTLTQQKQQKESVKQESFQKISIDEIQKDTEGVITKKKITFKQNFPHQKVEQIQQVSNQMKIYQQNQQTTNFEQSQDQLQIKNQNCAIIKKEDYGKQSSYLYSTSNLEESFDELEHIQPNLQEYQIQNEKIVNKVKKNIQKSSKKQSINAKQCEKRKLNSITEIQNSKSSIQIIHKIYQQTQLKNQASKQETYEYQLFVTKKIDKKCGQHLNNQDKQDIQNSNQQSQQKQQQLSIPAQYTSKQAQTNELKFCKTPQEFQPNIKIELCSYKPQPLKKNQTVSYDFPQQQKEDLKISESNKEIIYNIQKSNPLINGSDLNQIKSRFYQSKREQRTLQQQQFSRNQDSEQINYLNNDLETQIKIQKCNTDDNKDNKDQDKDYKVSFSKSAQKNSNIDNTSTFQCLRVLKEDKDEGDLKKSNIPNQNIQFHCIQEKLCEKQDIQNKQNNLISIENFQIKNLAIEANQKEHQQESISESSLKIEIEAQESQTNSCQRFQDNQQQYISQEDEKNQMNKVAIGNASKNILKAFQRYISNHEDSSQCAISSLNRMYQRNTLSNLLLIKIYLNQRYKKLMNEFIQSYASNWLIQSKVQNLEVHLKILDELKNNNVSLLKTKKKKYQRKKITVFNNQAKREKIQNKARTTFKKN
ncbi:hypothetical protein ABPG72_020954 [Tetrahymena utriculariae]